ncbi:putative membrane protein [Mycobacterium kansasii]|uniref:Putative membrane protein n=1 Tax=Mycobacterium kansasii TaxID=1768 RepID=A0A1V3WL53_MYCKA|nr:putative membrane protein [Mycobacterium kansasii]
MRSMLVWLMVCFGSVFAPASSAAGSCQPAELFATDNTWVITGSDAKATGQLHGDLEPFERQAVVTIAQTGAEVRGSTLVDGCSGPLRCSRSPTSAPASSISALSTNPHCTPPPRR